MSWRKPYLDIEREYPKEVVSPFETLPYPMSTKLESVSKRPLLHDLVSFHILKQQIGVQNVSGILNRAIDPPFWP